MKRFFRSIYYSLTAPSRAWKQYRALRGPTSTDAQPGSAEWLIVTERRFGGFVKNVVVNSISEADTRSLEEVSRLGMQGGDRMAFHGYARAYERFLLPLARNLSTGLIVEVGILRAQGLALWCELFPTWRVIGLDIDLKNAIDNLDALRDLGAFSTNKPELYKFDQLLPDNRGVADWLGEQRIAVLIDDGLHSVESVLKTADTFLPLMADTSVYIVEDFTADVGALRERAQKHGYDCFRQGKFTALTRALDC